MKWFLGTKNIGIYNLEAVKYRGRFIVRNRGRYILEVNNEVCEEVNEEEYTGCI